MYICNWNPVSFCRLIFRPSRDRAVVRPHRLARVTLTLAPRHRGIALQVGHRDAGSRGVSHDAGPPRLARAALTLTPRHRGIALRVGHRDAGSRGVSRDAGPPRDGRAMEAGGRTSMQMSAGTESIGNRQG
jgi:hypothetical protein